MLFKKIPKKFQLFGVEVEVKHDPSLNMNNGTTGEARYNEGTIVLQTPTDIKSQFKKDEVMRVFYHELVHWIFAMLEERELKSNEKLVDTMASLLHQATKTAKY